MYGYDEDPECGCVGLCLCDREQRIREEEIEAIESRLDTLLRQRTFESRREEKHYVRPRSFSRRTFCTNPDDYIAVASNSNINIKGHEETFREALKETCASCRWSYDCKRYSACPKIITTYEDKLKNQVKLKVGDKVIYRGYGRECLITKDSLCYRLVDLSTFVIYTKKYINIDDIIEDIVL